MLTFLVPLPLHLHTSGEIHNIVYQINSRKDKLVYCNSLFYMGIRVQNHFTEKTEQNIGVCPHVTFIFRRLFPTICCHVLASIWVVHHIVKWAKWWNKNPKISNVWNIKIGLNFVGSILASSPQTNIVPVQFSLPELPYPHQTFKERIPGQRPTCVKTVACSPKSLSNGSSSPTIKSK